MINEHDDGYDHDQEITEDNPMLSAYVLGELDDTERAVFEERLRDSADAQRLVEDYREVAGDLSNVFHGELRVDPSPALSDEQRAEIDRAAQAPAGATPAGGEVVPRSAWRFSVVATITALAASGIVAVSLALRQWDAPVERTTVARNELERDETPRWADPAMSATSATSAAPRAPAAGERSLDTRAALVESESIDGLRAASRPERTPSLGGVDESVAPASKPDSYSHDEDLRSQQALRKGLVRAREEEKLLETIINRASSARSDSAAAGEAAEASRGGRRLVLAPGEAQVDQTRARLIPAGSTKSEPADGAVPRGLAPVPEAAGLVPAPEAGSLPLPDPAAKRVPSTEAVRALGGRRGEVRMEDMKSARRRQSPRDLGRFKQPVAPGERDREVPEIRKVNPGFGRNTEQYEIYPDNAFVAVSEDPLSTFSIDVDTASYANVRRFLNQNMWPGRGVVRIEELVNYFNHDYEYAEPTGDHPFAVDVEVAECPWQGRHRLVRIGLKGKEVDMEKRPPSNFVFLLDVSGSMNRPNKLPLLKRSMGLLVDKLTENDRVAIVVYAGQEGLALPSTPGDQKELILSTIDSLSPHSGTHASAGIQLAYEIAVRNFIEGGTNRVILATDGDFNIGITDDDALVALIKDKARSDVFLSVLGFGTGNLKDAKMEKLANNGNGNYSYIDSLDEGRKVLVEEMAGTLLTIAKDVKIQVEFNPVLVASHRLIGYENRVLQHVEFNDDTRDAGEIGAGHTVTALYEVVPQSVALADAAEREASGEESAGSPSGTVDPLRFQKRSTDLTEKARSGELMFVKLRYKKPEGDTSTLLEVPVVDKGLKYGRASRDFKFAASVAAFGMILRDTAPEYRGNASLNAILELADEVKGDDPSGRREGFLELVRKAKALQEGR